LLAAEHDSQVVAWTACRMTLVTTSGSEIVDKYGAFTSVMWACAFSAMASCSAGGMAWSAVPTPAHDGMVCQAGTGAVRERFPGVRAVATPAVADAMRKWSAPEVLQSFWLPRFPGQIPEDNPVADPLDDPLLELEGNPPIAVNVGHTDTDDTTVLHVPDRGLVVAGDAVYNDVHQYLPRLASRPSTSSAPPRASFRFQRPWSATSQTRAAKGLLLRRRDLRRLALRPGRRRWPAR
jgi:hypothetical protein